jgi:Domain of unknown function (DUF4124)
MTHSLQITRSALIKSVVFAAFLAGTGVALAAPHKCVGSNGKVEYTDSPCKSGSTEKAITAKPVTVLKSESISGQPAQAKDTRPAWLKEANETFDPIAKCKAKGGTIDKEFRACLLP